MIPNPNLEVDSQIDIPDDQTYPDKNDDYHEISHRKWEKETETLQPLLSLKIKWNHIILGLICNPLGIYGLYLAFTAAQWRTLIFTFILDNLAIIGAMAGAHRLWAHRAYKATLPLKIILATFFSLSLQHNIYEFAQDHRVHHKHSDTDADPHNSKRGFWYSHMFWLAFDKTDACKKRTAEMDMSDLDADPVVQFHKKYYYIIGTIIGIILPTLIPMYFWNETFVCAFCVAVTLRLTLTYHQIFSINSFAHMWGDKPYDKSIVPVENGLVTFLSGGEGFHNYHHTFPWDYSASEFGARFNLSTTFINIMAWLGLAYDLKVVSKSMIEARKLRTGEKQQYKLKQEGKFEGNSVSKVTKED